MNAPAGVPGYARRLAVWLERRDSGAGLDPWLARPEGTWIRAGGAQAEAPSPQPGIRRAAPEGARERQKHRRAKKQTKCGGGRRAGEAAAQVEPEFTLSSL